MFYARPPTPPGTTSPGDVPGVGRKGTVPDPPRVVVVEDEPLILLALVSNLTEAGCLVVGRCTRGEDAIAVATREEPDLVVMDVHLAGAMDGIEAAACIQAATEAQIVFVSAFADGPDRARMEALDPLAIFSKPYDSDRLATVAKHVRKRAPA